MRVRGFAGEAAACMGIRAMRLVVEMRHEERAAVLQSQVQPGAEPSEQKKRCEEFPGAVHAPEISAATLRRVKAFVSSRGPMQSSAPAALLPTGFIQQAAVAQRSMRGARLRGGKPL